MGGGGGENVGLTVGLPPHALSYSCHDQQQRSLPSVSLRVTMVQVTAAALAVLFTGSLLLVVVEGAVFLDRRVVSTSVLTFPRFGGARRGTAGCPVRRVLHPRSGELHCPLSTAACSGLGVAGERQDQPEWIVQLRGDGTETRGGQQKAECRPAPCSRNGTILWTDGACHRPEEAGLCGEGMRLYVDRYGDAYCDCKPNHYLWPLQGACYPALTQGPCEAGHHLRLLGTGRGVPVCQRNPCIWEHLVEGSDGKCHEIGNPALCPAGRVFVANPETGQPECVSSQFLAELARDLHGCFVGSRKSLLQACQT